MTPEQIENWLRQIENQPTDAHEEKSRVSPVKPKPPVKLSASDIGQILGDESLASAEIVKRVTALAKFAKDLSTWINAHPKESQPWAVKMGEATESVAFVFANNPGQK